MFEGILTLYEQRFRDLMDLKIFVLTDDDIRLSRRSKSTLYFLSLSIVLRDWAERGRTVESIID